MFRYPNAPRRRTVFATIFAIGMSGSVGVAQEFAVEPSVPGSSQATSAPKVVIVTTLRAKATHTRESLCPFRMYRCPLAYGPTI